MRPRPIHTLLLAAVPLIAAPPAAASAQEAEPTVVLLVRHAETEADGSPDPALSEPGRRTAGRLAATLADVALKSVHSTPYRRTMATAGIIAAAQGLEVQEYDPGSPGGLLDRLRGAGGAHLVVGHSNTTPALVQALGGEAGPPIAETEHDRLYVLVLDEGDVETLRLRIPGDAGRDPSASAGAGGSAAAQSPLVAGRPADVRTLDGILDALYDVISGPAGEPRDWNRMRSLFYPTARMIPTQRRPDGQVAHRALTVEDYIETSGPMLERLGFREREVARRVDRFGDVAQVFSTYEGFREGQAEPLVSGINSIQLIHDGQRWWITSLAWSPTRPDLPVPPEYRPPGR